LLNASNAANAVITLYSNSTLIAQREYKEITSNRPPRRSLAQP
jgi:hypothetical protein